MGPGNRGRSCEAPAGGALCRGSKSSRGPPNPFSPIIQENQGPALANDGSPKDSPAHEVTTGPRGAYTRFDVPRARVERSWPSFRGGWLRGEGAGGAGGEEVLTEPPTALLLHRYVVARAIWADMLAIAVTYFITLCLFPGLESEIRHCVLGEWLPILVMAVFNLSDFVGKVRAAPGGVGRRRAQAVGRWGREAAGSRVCRGEPGGVMCPRPAAPALLAASSLARTPGGAGGGGQGPRTRLEEARRFPGRPAAASSG